MGKCFLYIPLHHAPAPLPNLTTQISQTFQVSHESKSLYSHTNLTNVILLCKSFENKKTKKETDFLWLEKGKQINANKNLYLLFCMKFWSLEFQFSRSICSSLVWQTISNLLFSLTRQQPKVPVLSVPTASLKD